jgi:hypothetical protein
MEQCPLCGDIFFAFSIDLMLCYVTFWNFAPL